MASLAVSALALSAACSTTPDDERTGSVAQAIKAPLDAAFCTATLTGGGDKAMEDDYLPHVVTCENGGADLEALKAQAIAARSVAYYAMAGKGSICDGQGCQVYTCNAQPSALAKQAVAETSGQYLAYGGMLTYGFYVAGDPQTQGPDCVGDPAAKTEKWVTYNEGLSGTAVEQTALGYIGPPGFGQNRGCMSQWGARCLEKRGEDAKGILQFYYGADIELLQAEGPCVTPPGSSGSAGGSAASGGDAVTSGAGGEGAVASSTSTAGGGDTGASVGVRATASVEASCSVGWVPSSRYGHAPFGVLALLAVGLAWRRESSRR